MDQKIILVAEDSPLSGADLRNSLEKTTLQKVIWVKSHPEAMDILNKSRQAITVAVVNYNLPGADDGETIAQTLLKGIPTIAFTGAVDSQVRERLWSLQVVDYVLKDSPSSLDYVVSMVKRVIKNRAIKALVVDDSAPSRDTFSRLLKIHCYQVLTADNGKDALELLVQNPDLRLVIAGNQMSGMGGIQLVQKIRERYSRNQLGIIGIADAGDSIMAAKFIKNGANDFIIKQDFLAEEFYSRVNQCMDQVEHVASIREAAIKDPLTRLFNRRYFFEMGNKMMATAARGNHPVVVAMLDVDHFKKINDRFGHQAGDMVLKRMAALLQKRCRKSDLLARFGGEEFCFLGYNMDPSHANMFFDMFCTLVEAHPVETASGECVPVTISIGVCREQLGDLEEMLRRAEANLNKAKKSGRNQVACN